MHLINKKTKLVVAFAVFLLSPSVLSATQPTQFTQNEISSICINNAINKLVNDNSSRVAKIISILNDDGRSVPDLSIISLPIDPQPNMTIEAFDFNSRDIMINRTSEALNNIIKHSAVLCPDIQQLHPKTLPTDLKGVNYLDSDLLDDTVNEINNQTDAISKINQCFDNQKFILGVSRYDVDRMGS